MAESIQQLSLDGVRTWEHAPLPFEDESGNIINLESAYASLLDRADVSEAEIAAFEQEFLPL